MELFDPNGVVTGWLSDLVDQHAVAVQAVATALLAVFTGVYVYLTNRLLSAARRSQRPYVYLNVAARGGDYLEFGLANHGDRAAEAVRIDVQSDIMDAQGRALADEPPFSSGITYLPPGATYQWSFIAPNNFFDPRPGRNVLDATIHYQFGNVQYSERVYFDFASLNGVLLRSFADSQAEVAVHLARIARELSDARWDKRLHQMRVPGLLSLCPLCREPLAPQATRCPHCHGDLQGHDTTVEDADSD